MKRCPECQFLYENETTLCEMDGTPLRYTVKLPAVPGLAQSIWDRWTIALLFAVVAATVLVILYRATPRAYTSTAGHAKTLKSELPAVNQNPLSADSVAPESTAAQSAIDNSDSSTDVQDPFAALSTAGKRAPKSKRVGPTLDDQEPAPGPVIHLPPAETPQKLSASSAVVEPLTNQTTNVGTSAPKPASSGTSASFHPPPPAAISKPTPGQKKESGFKSLLKKAGKVLKKPFGEN